MIERMKALAEKLLAIGAREGDSRDERIRKAVLHLFALAMILGAPVDGYLSLSGGQRAMGMILMAYTGATLVGYVHFVATGRRALFQRTQFALILAMVGLIDFLAGGLAESQGSVMWAGIMPLGAFLLTSKREATLWFVAYLVAITALLAGDGWISRDAAVRATEEELYSMAGLLYGFTGMVVGLVYYFVVRLQRAREELVEKNAALEAERAKSERLLLNVLPAQIASRLKAEGDRTIADGFDEVTVLFADLVGFTNLSSRTEPGPLVSMLDGVFTAFDGLAEEAGAEKIKTIGDAYMAAAGLPEERPDHAAVMARMALGLRESLEILNEERGTSLRIRVGLHTGPVIAGVLGTKKFQYDLWGDTVNTASRMESHGEPGRIQVSEATYMALKDEFRFEERGVIEVKGKGPMRTYFLEGER